MEWRLPYYKESKESLMNIRNGILFRVAFISAALLSNQLSIADTSVDYNSVNLGALQSQYQQQLKPKVRKKRVRKTASNQRRTSNSQKRIQNQEFLQYQRLLSRQQQKTSTSKSESTSKSGSKSSTCASTTPSSSCKPSCSSPASKT